jgi:hypothetical protein
VFFCQMFRGDLMTTMKRLSVQTQISWEDIGIDLH